MEYNLARLRRLGFARSLRRLRDERGGGAAEIDDEALAAQLTATYFDHRDRDPALFDDTLPCLEALRDDYRLGLLSNGSRLPEVVGLGGILRSRRVRAGPQCGQTGSAGSSPWSRQLMGVAPESAVLVGDHPLNDVVGAKRSGWRAVWIDRSGEGLPASTRRPTNAPTPSSPRWSNWPASWPHVSDRARL